MANGAPTVSNGLVISGVTTSTNVSVASSVTATTYYGSGANLTNITQTTINNNADNRVITGSNTSNTLEGESNVVINGGKLGIGVASPAQLIEVHGASNPAVLVQDTTNNCISYMYSQDSVATFGSASNHPVVFNVNNGEKLRIGTNGSLSINYAGNGDNTLHIGCTSNAGGIIIKAPGNHYANIVTDSNRSGATGGMGIGGGALKFYYGTTERFTVSNTRIDAKEPLYLETAGSYIKSNQLYFNPSGAAYIDHGVTGQPLNFRMSSSSALDTNAMTINHNGHVTIPNQPILSMKVNSSIQSGNYMIHSGVITNNGNHYNTGNGRFTCPVAGFYYCSIMVMSNNSNTTMDLELHKNSSNASDILVPYQAATGGQYNQVSGSCILQCSANDILQFKLNSGSVYDGRHSNITFALLA